MKTKNTLKNTGALLLMTVLCLSCLFVSGCGKKNELFSKRCAPENCMLCLYRYDGTDTVCRYVADASVQNSFFSALEKVKAVPVADWMPAGEAKTLYGIETMDLEGRTLTYLIVDGHLITNDGAVYEFPADPEKLWNETHADIDEFTMEKSCAVPGLSYIVKGATGFDTTYMKPAPASYEGDAGITMTIESIEGNIFTVNFENHSGDVWTFGYYFHLDVLSDGSWYQVPEEQEFMIPDLALIVEDGTVRTETYNITPYGALPDGTYRLYIGIGDPVRGNSCEFMVSDGQAVMK